MKVKKIVYLKAVEELLETAKNYFSNVLIDLDKHIDGVFTPEIKLSLDINPCRLASPYNPKGRCWVSVKSTVDEDELSLSTVKQIAIQNPKNLEEDEKRLREKLNNAE